MEKYDSIYRYLESGIYPEGLLKNEKRNFRRKCKENFKIEKGQLYYSKRRVTGVQQHIKSLSGNFVLRMKMINKEC